MPGMSEYLKQILAGQYEAALCMLRETLEACPAERWEGKIAFLTFGQTAYHTLFFTDYYLSRTQSDFELRELNVLGGDERVVEVSPGLGRAQTIEYLMICREKARAALGAETGGSLVGPSGFERRTFSRGELHLYNIRHVQHHTGQLQAYLRRVDEGMQNPEVMRWVGSGWRG